MMSYGSLQRNHNQEETNLIYGVFLEALFVIKFFAKVYDEAKKDLELLKGQLWAEVSWEFCVDLWMPNKFGQMPKA